MRTFHAALFVVLFAAVGPPPAVAQYSAAVETAAGKIFNTTMSPFCPGRTLATCPSPQAAELKRDIRARLAAGVSPDAIRSALIVEYGEAVRAAPPARGLGLLAWLLPGAMLALAGGLVLWHLRQAATTVRSAAGAALDPESQAIVDRALSDL